MGKESSRDKVKVHMHWNTITNRFLDLLAVLVLSILSGVLFAGCGDRETILVIEKPTEVRSIKLPPSSPESSSASLEPGHVIVTLKAGETAKAIGVYHGLDHDGFKVKLVDGNEGLITAGDTFKIQSR
jgi:hypothetical protein